jgi:hypothetical protein
MVTCEMNVFTTFWQELEDSHQRILSWKPRSKQWGLDFWTRKPDFHLEYFAVVLNLMIVQIHSNVKCPKIAVLTSRRLFSWHQDGLLYSCAGCPRGPAKSKISQVLSQVASFFRCRIMSYRYWSVFLTISYLSGRTERKVFPLFWSDWN